jgi:prepilin peptidase CpaA
MDISDPRLAPMILLLLAAAVTDVRTWRIPNGLVVAGTFFGLLGQMLAPSGHGIAFALAGVLTGLLLPLPLYCLRGLAAGDVKLLGMVGAYLGAADTLAAVVLTFLAGGVLAVGLAAWRGALGQLRENLRLLFFGFLVQSAGGAGQLPKPASVGRIPYAVAIAAGTLAWVMLRHLQIGGGLGS